MAPGGDARFSVAIRTALARADGAGRGLAIEYGTGGGIVWDSVPERELEETRTKALILRACPSGARGSAGLTRAMGPRGAGSRAVSPGRGRRLLELLETLLWRPPTPGPRLQSRSVFPARGESVEPPAPTKPREPTTALPDERGFALLERHLERLTRSAEESGFHSTRRGSGRTSRRSGGGSRRTPWRPTSGSGC